jgi:hypothetical protein
MLYGPTRNQKPGFYRTFAETQLGEINDTQSIFLLSGRAGRVCSRESPENPLLRDWYPPGISDD